MVSFPQLVGLNQLDPVVGTWGFNFVTKEPSHN